MGFQDTDSELTRRILCEIFGRSVTTPIINALVREATLVVPRGPPAPGPAKVPPLDIYITNLIKHLGISPSVLLLPLVYIQRIKKALPIPPKDYVVHACAPHRVATAAMMLAEKFLYDAPMLASTWAENSRVFNLHDIKLMEYEFLCLLDFNISLKPKDVLNKVTECIGIHNLLPEDLTTFLLLEHHWIATKDETTLQPLPVCIWSSRLRHSNGNGMENVAGVCGSQTPADISQQRYTQGYCDSGLGWNGGSGYGGIIASHPPGLGGMVKDTQMNAFSAYGGVGPSVNIVSLSHQQHQNDLWLQHQQLPIPTTLFHPSSTAVPAMPTSSQQLFWNAFGQPHSGTADQAAFCTGSIRNTHQGLSIHPPTDNRVRLRLPLPLLTSSRSSLNPDTRTMLPIPIFFPSPSVPSISHAPTLRHDMPSTGNIWSTPLSFSTNSSGSSSTAHTWSNERPPEAWLAHDVDQQHVLHHPPPEYRPTPCYTNMSTHTQNNQNNSDQHEIHLPSFATLNAMSGRPMDRADASYTDSAISLSVDSLVIPQSQPQTFAPARRLSHVSDGKGTSIANAQHSPGLQYCARDRHTFWHDDLGIDTQILSSVEY